MTHFTSHTSLHAASDIAHKLRDHFPRAEMHAIGEYLEALCSYEAHPTPQSLDRLITAAHVVSIPTIDIDQL